MFKSHVSSHCQYSCFAAPSWRLEQLWKDMRTVILPGLVRKIGVIPIPRIEYVDDDLDLVVENLTLQGANLFPTYVSSPFRGLTFISLYHASESSKSRRSTTLSSRPWRPSRTNTATPSR